MSDRFREPSIVATRKELNRERAFEKEVDALVEEYLTDPDMVREIIAEDRGALETALMLFVLNPGHRTAAADYGNILREEIEKEARRIAEYKLS